MYYLKGGGAVQFGGVNRVWQHVGDVGDELFQAVTGQLKVCGVNDDLNQLDELNSVPCNSSGLQTDTQTDKNVFC